MAKRHGYEIVKHEVITKDGYILGIYRISCVNHTNVGKQQPVYLLHGALSSSDAWVNLGRKSLGFKLADKGYDVWLGNTRGNFHSPGHIKYNLKENSFWNYTLDDMGNYDMPAAMDYIKQETNKQIVHIGHSQGSLQALMYAVRHHSEAKLNLKGLILLAPVTFIPYVNDLTLELFKLASSLIKKVAIRTNIVTKICTSTKTMLQICNMFTDLMYGPNNNTYVMEEMPLFYSYMYNRESMKPLYQVSQQGNAQRFQSFDYDIKNKFIYHSEKPPSYEINKIQVPTYLFVGTNDKITTVERAQWIYGNLTVSEKEIHVLNNFNHMSYFFSKDVEGELHSKIFNILENKLVDF